MNPNDPNYGEGSPPANLVAIPSQTSYYFTEGKEYPIIAHNAYNYTVLCDCMLPRYISMKSGERSAHLVPTDTYDYRKEDLGTFEICVRSSK